MSRPIRDPAIARFAQVFGYDYAEASRRLAERANLKHMRPASLAREILDSIHRKSPRQVANELMATKGLPPFAYDDALTVATVMRSAIRHGGDYSEAKKRLTRRGRILGRNSP